MRSLAPLSLSLSLLLAVACNGEPSTTIEPVCSEPAELSCVDEMILDLGLQESVNTDDVTNTQDGEDWVTVVDATAGGYQAASTNPWIYLRFTETGAERVDIDDESALESMAWHIAARRFIVRVNSGSSGPSCVGAAAYLEKSYDELVEIPADVRYYEDDYYTSDCTIINDSSGLPGSPQVALAPWWSYDGCVATSSVPFLLQLDDGGVIKLVVESYYGSGQEACNESGAPGDDSGLYTWRWRFLQ